MTDFPESTQVLDRRAAAAFLTARGFRIAYATLAKLACIGGGPAFAHWGRTPVYRPSDLLDWVEERTSALKRSTSG